MAVSEVILAVMGLVAGAAAGAAVVWMRAVSARSGFRAQSEQILRDAERERERLLKDAEIDAKAKLLAAQEEHERQAKLEREELAAAEKKLRARESNAERKTETLEQRERELKRRESEAKEAGERAQGLEREAESRAADARRELERVAALTREQAKEELIKSIEDDARRLAAVRVKAVEDEARRDADDRAKRIIASAIQRFAGGFVAEKTVAVVELPNDEMKGRIIGREGRNIRAIESATGVDVIIDDTPEVVVVSTFNPMRREIARLALERLVADGRIHPARIEEVVQQVEEELEGLTQRAGEQATFDLGLHGIHPELVKLVGRLRYRSVNAQNLWNHSVETAVIAGMMAEELGFDPTLAKRAGLLHDVGKAVDHETPGPHWAVSAEQARRYGEKPDVVNAIRSYHDEAPPSVLGVLLQAADGMSKARPGARRDLLETYIKRLDDLERIPLGFKGVERAFALQAGREVRVMVDYRQVSDDEALLLSNDIARRIQDTLTYPGEVKVTVIRESRATEFAK